MGDDLGNGGALRSVDVARTVERPGAVARVDRRSDVPDDPPDGIVRTARGAAPGAGSIATPADAIALGEARDRIAAVLARADATGGGSARTLAALNSIPPLPLGPGADAGDLANAQALAGLIVANARPALAAQARIGRAAVRLMIDD